MHALPERGLKDVEILGYFLDLKNEKLLATLQKRQESKIRKTTRQVELIERNGYMIPIGEVVEKARVPRRIHIWEVLQQHNPNIIREEFFSRTGYGGSWYVEEDFTITVEDCVRLIKDAEGVPVVAHPGCYNERFRTENLLRDENTFNVLTTCVNAGACGIEVFYPYHKERPYYNRGSSLITNEQYMELIASYKEAAGDYQVH